MTARLVSRMAAEQEQANPAWSRPPKAQDPKTMKHADYLAAAVGVSDAAVYNAACVFALASLDDHAGAAEREARARKAIDYLSRIAGHGYFEGEKQGRELLTDHDLDAVRTRGEFQAIVAKVRPGSPAAGAR